MSASTCSARWPADTTCHRSAPHTITIQGRHGPESRSVCYEHKRAFETGLTADHSQPPSRCVLLGCAATADKRGLCSHHFETVATAQLLDLIGRPADASEAALAPVESLPEVPVPDVSRRCKEPGCSRLVKTRGLCGSHHEKARRAGAFKDLPAPTLCSESGCDKPIRKRGMCDAHYQRARKRGAFNRSAKAPTSTPVTEDMHPADEQLAELRSALGEGCEGLTWAQALARVRTRTSQAEALHRYLNEIEAPAAYTSEERVRKLVDAVQGILDTTVPLNNEGAKDAGYHCLQDVVLDWTDRVLGEAPLVKKTRRKIASVLVGIMQIHSQLRVAVDAVFAAEGNTGWMPADSEGVDAALTLLGRMANDARVGSVTAPVDFVVAEICDDEATANIELIAEPANTVTRWAHWTSLPDTRIDWWATPYNAGGRGPQVRVEITTLEPRPPHDLEAIAFEFGRRLEVPLLASRLPRSIPFDLPQHLRDLPWVEAAAIYTALVQLQPALEDDVRATTLRGALTGLIQATPSVWESPESRGRVAEALAILMEWAANVIPF